MPMVGVRNPRRAFRTRPSCSRSLVLVYRNDNEISRLGPTRTVLPGVDEGTEKEGFYQSIDEESSDAFMGNSLVNVGTRKPAKQRGKKVVMPEPVEESSDSDVTDSMAVEEETELVEDLNQAEQEMGKLQKQFNSDEEFSLYFEDENGDRLMEWNGNLVPFDEELYGQKKEAQRKKQAKNEDKPVSTVPSDDVSGQGSSREKSGESKRKNSRKNAKKSTVEASSETPAKSQVKTALDKFRMSIARVRAKTPQALCVTPQKSFIFTGQTSTVRSLGRRYNNSTYGVIDRSQGDAPFHAKRLEFEDESTLDEPVQAHPNIHQDQTAPRDADAAGSSDGHEDGGFVVPKGRIRLSRLSPIRRDSRMMTSSPIAHNNVFAPNPFNSPNVPPQLCSTPINAVTRAPVGNIQNASSLSLATPLASSTPIGARSSGYRLALSNGLEQIPSTDFDTSPSSQTLVHDVSPQPITLPASRISDHRGSLPLTEASADLGMEFSTVSQDTTKPAGDVAKQSRVESIVSEQSTRAEHMEASAAVSNCSSRKSTSDHGVNRSKNSTVTPSLSEAVSSTVDESPSNMTASVSGKDSAVKSANPSPAASSDSSSRRRNSSGNKRRSGSGVSSSVSSRSSLPIGKRRRTSVTGNSRPSSRCGSVHTAIETDEESKMQEDIANEGGVDVPTDSRPTSRLARDDVISEKDDVISWQDDVISKKDDVISEKDDVISEKDDVTTVAVSGGPVEDTSSKLSTEREQSSTSHPDGGDADVSDMAAALDRSLSLSFSMEELNKRDHHMPGDVPNETAATMDVQHTMAEQDTMQNTMQNTLSATLNAELGDWNRAPTRATNMTVLSNMTNMSMMSQYGGRTRNVTQVCNQTQTRRNVSLLRNESDIMGNDGETVVPFYLQNYEEDGSPLSMLLHVIEQKGIWSWHDLPKDVFETPRKLGEGVYGEVFGTMYDGQPTALKVIPFHGDEVTYTGLVNGESLWEAEEIIPEILITRELSALYDPTGQYSTPNFIRLLKANVVQGPYAESLLTAWDEFDERKTSENDRPSIYSSEKQLQLTIGLAMGGVDLESYQLKNENQVISVLLQTALSLLIAEQVLQFEHRDLHIGNILAAEQKEDVKYRYDGDDVVIRSHGVKINIIDFTLSRLHKSGTTIFRDLEPDEELFQGKGLYQFDIYRMMRKHNKGNWNSFEPKSNVFWLHYLSKELIETRKCKKAITKKRKAELSKLFDGLLELASLQDLFTSPLFSDLLQKFLIKT